MSEVQKKVDWDDPKFLKEHLNYKHLTNEYDKKAIADDLENWDYTPYYKNIPKLLVSWIIWGAILILIIGALICDCKVDTDNFLPIILIYSFVYIWRSLKIVFKVIGIITIFIILACLLFPAPGLIVFSFFYGLYAKYFMKMIEKPRYKLITLAFRDDLSRNMIENEEAKGSLISSVKGVLNLLEFKVMIKMQDRYVPVLWLESLCIIFGVIGCVFIIGFPISNLGYIQDISVCISAIFLLTPALVSYFRNRYVCESSSSRWTLFVLSLGWIVLITLGLAIAFVAAWIGFILFVAMVGITNSINESLARKGRTAFYLDYFVKSDGPYKWTL